MGSPNSPIHIAHGARAKTTDTMYIAASARVYHPRAFKRFDLIFRPSPTKNAPSGVAWYATQLHTLQAAIAHGLTNVVTMAVFTRRIRHTPFLTNVENTFILVFSKKRSLARVETVFAGVAADTGTTRYDALCVVKKTCPNSISCPLRSSQLLQLILP